MNFDGARLTPLFYSELSSSHLLYDIFNGYPEITIALIKHCFSVDAEQVMVTRERNYPKKGSIDIFIEFKEGSRKCALLLEVKVHDYLSVTDHQIETYYKAVMEDEHYDQVYFIFLTQFNDQAVFENIVRPKSIAEASRGKELIGDRFCHLSWEEMHSFLGQYKSHLNRERRLMLDLQHSWVTDKSRADLSGNEVETGERSLEDYFGDIKEALSLLKPLGEKYSQNNRLKLRIETSRLIEGQLNDLLKGIKMLSGSGKINRKKRFRNEELTVQAAEDFLSELAINREWKLLGFYASLFEYAYKTDYLRFNGTGTSGFSIRADIEGKGEISMCTLYRNKVVDFSLKR